MFYYSPAQISNSYCIQLTSMVSYQLSLSCNKIGRSTLLCTDIFTYYDNIHSFHTLANPFLPSFSEFSFSGFGFFSKHFRKPHKFIFILSFFFLPCIKLSFSPFLLLNTATLIFDTLIFRSIAFTALCNYLQIVWILSHSYLHTKVHVHSWQKRFFQFHSGITIIPIKISKYYSQHYVTLRWSQIFSSFLFFTPCISWKL